MKVFGKVVPNQKWVLTRENDGQLVTSLINYKSGISESLGVAQFAREGTMGISLFPSIADKGFINEGDTIGLISSSETDERLVALKGELAVARATLASSFTGEKEQVVRVFEKEITYARAKAKEQRKKLKRLEALFDKNMVSQEEYETAQNETVLLEIEVSIIEAELEAARTGEKPEQIELLKARRDALELEMEILGERLRSFSVVAPISGRISWNFSPDTLLVISDTSAFIILMPVKWDEYPFVSNAQQVRVRLNNSMSVEGQLLDHGEDIRSINGESVFIARGVLEEQVGNLMPGMLAQCVITCEPVTVLEFIKRFLLSLAV